MARKIKDVGLPLEGMLNGMARVSYGMSNALYMKKKKR